ncbi:MAG: hypothetical protein M9951_01890 [Burkholderiaceae bacterium]|jgi:hypothetical protein|nr:hypothetical protein [Burkholderiaceae bacterium]MEB2318570.1 hypothetical protein [Pseudomonadota bacterium]
MPDSCYNLTVKALLDGNVPATFSRGWFGQPIDDQDLSGFGRSSKRPANPVDTEDSLKATPKPSSAMSATHQKSVVSKRQAERMRRGRVESRPEDYKNIAPSEHAKRLHEARSRLEDRKMMMELGLL